MNEQQRLEAIGSRGEACIILSAEVDMASGGKARQYKLATGERLRPTEIPGEFETLDGKRQFKLR